MGPVRLFPIFPQNLRDGLFLQIDKKRQSRPAYDEVVSSFPIAKCSNAHEDGAYKNYWSEDDVRPVFLLSRQILLHDDIQRIAIAGKKTTPPSLSQSYQPENVGEAHALQRQGHHPVGGCLSRGAF